MLLLFFSLKTSASNSVLVGLLLKMLLCCRVPPKVFFCYSMTERVSSAQILFGPWLQLLLIFKWDHIFVDSGLLFLKLNWKMVNRNMTFCISVGSGGQEVSSGYYHTRKKSTVCQCVVECCDCVFLWSDYFHASAPFFSIILLYFFSKGTAVQLAVV